MKKSEKKVIKINWGQIIKRISPYNVKKGIFKTLWNERVLGKTY